MQNKLIDQAIAEYLQQLKQALAGQDTALIQDAQYDAEEHLRAALDDQAEAENAFQKVCEEYGSPHEIAEFYCDMESTVKMALHGAKKSAIPVHNKRFFGIIKDNNAYLAMLYMLLALPVGIIYFGWISIVGVASLASSIFIIGIPAFLLFLGSMQLFAFFEGRLIEMLLGQRMPRRPQYQRSQTYQSKWQEWKVRLSSMLHNKRNWSTLLYLLLRLPLGFAYFTMIACGAIMSLAVMISPLVDPILHAIDPANTIDIDWYWFPVAVPGGFVGFVLTLHLAKLAGKFQAWLARYLLVSIASDD